MNVLSLLLLLALVAIALVAAFNWEALSQVGPMNLGVTQLDAPLGLVLLGLTGLIALLFLGWVLWMQGKVLVEARRHAREMQEQRALADRAEASRFTELRQFLEQQYQTSDQQLQERFEQLQARLQERMEEHSNTMLAHVANLENQWERWGGRSAVTARSAAPTARDDVLPSPSLELPAATDGSAQVEEGKAMDPLQDVVPEAPPSGLARFMGKQGFFRRGS